MATPIPRNRARFRLSEIARIAGGTLHGDDAMVTGILTDSRAVEGEELFVALVGARFDGHAHAEAAIAAGARAALVMRDVPSLEGRPHVRVRDTLDALGALARAHRERWGGKVVGVTGSAGKTGTKEAIATALRGAGHRVLATPGNLNNRVGVPMTLLTLEDESVAVIEMGTSEPGEIAKLAAIAQPTIGVITMIDVAHTEGLGDLDAVANEKGALFLALGDNDVAIGSIDEPMVRDLLERVDARVFSFGRTERSKLRILETSFSERGTRVEYQLGGSRGVLELPLLGEPAVSQAAIALLVVEAVRGDRTGAIDALSRAPRTPGRLVPEPAASGLLVLDDSYNANPRSMHAALDLATQLACARGGRAIAVLGEMKELGAASESAHEAVSSVEDVTYFVVGPAFARALESRGEGDRVYGSPEDAARAASRAAEPSDVVVVKGSRSMEMERAIPILLGEERTTR
jgi:UDP-N-acetylmuramoyl-tripeptide--D-alanyl-D-alanine ligase